MHIYVTQRSDKEGLVSSIHGAEADHAFGLSAIYVPDEAEILPGSSALAYPEIPLEAPGQGSSPELRNTSSDSDIADAIENDQTVQFFDSLSYLNIAKTLVYHHGDLMAIDAHIGKTILKHIEHAPGLYELAFAIRRMGRHNWYSTYIMRDDNGTPIRRQSDQSIIIGFNPKREVQAAAQKCLLNALNSVYNDPALQSRLYSGAVPSKVNESNESVSSEPADALNTRSETRTKDGTYILTSEGTKEGFEAELVKVIGKDVTIDFRNSYKRHLSTVIEFLDVDGRPVAVRDWDSKLKWVDPATRDRIESDSTKFLTIINPPSDFLAFKVSDASEDVTFGFPDNATQARIYTGGIGHGGPKNRAAEEFGIGLTAAFELGLPAALLAATAAIHKEDPNGEGIKQLFRLSTFSDIIKVFFASIWARGETSTGDILNTALNFFLNLAAKYGFNWALVRYMTEQEGLSATEDAIPVVGWAMAAASIATTTSALGQATCQLNGSTRVMVEGLSRVHDVELNIARDISDFEFPATATHFDAFLEFSSARRVKKTIRLPKTTVSSARRVLFKNVPMGGTVEAKVYFYSDNDWLAAVGHTGPFRNLNDLDSDKLTLNLQIEERLVPLSGDTKYSHKEKLVSSASGFSWESADAPEQAINSLSSNQQQGSLSSLGVGSVNQTRGRFSYSWQSFSGPVRSCSGGSNVLGYSYRTIGLGENPNEGVKFASCYDSAPSIVRNQLFSKVTLGGVTDQNILVAPAGNGSYAVQYFNLDDSANYQGEGVLGTFGLRQDDIRRVSDNVLIGISRTYNKLFQLRLADSPTSLEQAPEASALLGPGRSEEATRNNPSLLLAPRALAVGADETLIVLEVDPAKPGSAGILRAFNKDAVPRNYFKNGRAHRAALKADSQNLSYLALDIEAKGYIYVLGHRNLGHERRDFFVQIYTPEGNFLSETNGVAAASLSLDAWRNIYTLNYEAIQAPTGDTEPSVSQWIPSTPTGTELDS